MKAIPKGRIIRLIYAAPFPPIQSGIADYADTFQRAIKESGVAEIHGVPLDDETDRSLLRIRKKIKVALAYSSQTNRDNRQSVVFHVEIGLPHIACFYFALLVKTVASKAKLCVTIHDPPILVQDPLLLVRNWGGCLPERILKKILRLTLGRLAENILLLLADRIMVLSEIGKFKVKRRYFGVLNRKFHILTFPVEMPDEVCKCQGEQIKIIYFGYIVSLRGIDLLLKAYAKVVNDNQIFKDKTKIDVCGFVPQAIKGSYLYSRAVNYYESVRTLAKNLQIADLVKFRGFIQPDMIFTTFHDADVLVLPYRKAGTVPFSSVLIRGMSYGLVVMASRVGSFPEVIKDRYTGVLFEPDNVDDLAEKLHEIIINHDMRNKIGERAKAHVKRVHCPRRTAEEVGCVYQELI